MQLAGYRLGFTDVLKTMMRMHTKRWRSDGNSGEGSDQAVFVLGFSLGANVAFKALGKLGRFSWTLYGVQSAAITGAPFDDELNQKYDESPGFNKLV